MLVPLLVSSSMLYVRPSAIGISVLVCLISLAGCQIEFREQHRFHGLDILCSVGDLKSTSFSNLDSLLIFKLVAGTRKILASVSAHYGQNDPVSHLAHAEVTGHLSNDDLLQRYLRIVWTYSETDLDGEYICDLNGVDTNYIPLTVTQHLTVQVNNICPCFAAIPEIIQVGLTRELELMCSLPDPPAINISKLASLEIINVNEGIKQVLAEINSMTGTAVVQGSSASSVNGSINGKNTFLKVVWEYPTANMASEYTCEGSGVDIFGDPIFFRRQINVTLDEPDPHELVQRLFEMYNEQKEYFRCQEEIEKLTNTFKPELSSQTPTDIPNPTTRSRPKSCEELPTQKGLHVITIDPEDGLGPITVLCHVFGPNDKWTVFQRRFNGSVDFYRNFSEYRNGFGSVYGEFWLGLENTRRLLLRNGDKNQLRIDLKELISLIPHSINYSSFSLGPGDGYTLNIFGGADDGGYGMSSDVGQNFSTYDRGYTMIADASNRAAGWWFPLSGGYVNLNGKWGIINELKSMSWYEFHMSWAYPMGETEMLFRRN